VFLFYKDIEIVKQTWKKIVIKLRITIDFLIVSQNCYIAHPYSKDIYNVANYL